MKQARKLTRADKAALRGVPLKSCKTCVHMDQDATQDPCVSCLANDPHFQGDLPAWEAVKIVNPPSFEGACKWKAPTRDKF